MHTYKSILPTCKYVIHITSSYEKISQVSNKSNFISVLKAKFHFCTPLITLKNLWFSNVFKGYRNGTLVQDGLIFSSKNLTCRKQKCRCYEMQILLFNQKFPLRVSIITEFRNLSLQNYVDILNFFSVKNTTFNRYIFVSLKFHRQQLQNFCVNYCFKFHEQPVIEVFPWILFAQTSLKIENQRDFIYMKIQSHEVQPKSAILSHAI